MCYNDSDKQKQPFLASQKKMYVAPRTHIAFIGTIDFLATSNPNASVDDIKPGGDLYDEIDDE